MQKVKYVIVQKKMNQMGKFSSNVKIVSTAKSTDDSTRMLALYRNNNIKGKVCIVIKEFKYDKEEKYTFYKIMFNKKIMVTFFLAYIFIF